MNIKCDVLFDPTVPRPTAVAPAIPYANRAPNAVSAAEPEAPPQRTTEPAQRTAELEAGAGSLGIAAMIELILKDRRSLDRLSRTRAPKVDLASRLLAISLTSFALYGLAMCIIFNASHEWPVLTSPARWINDPQMQFVTLVDPSTLRASVAVRAIQLIFAYSFGLIAASGICLPSLYFYGLLSGLRMTMADVAVHTLKGTAVTAVALIGILPVYSAMALGAIVLPFSREFIGTILLLGLGLPFIAGLWGTRSLFVGFVDLCHTMPAEFQNRRACFLRRLVWSWCACYMAVAPLMIITVWRQF
jgi:hypothetical protein